MDVIGFWKLVDDAARNSKGANRAFLRLIRRDLEKLPPPELVEFKSRFEEHMDRAFHWDLWGAASIMRGGCSDDGFEYFRAWLISRGQAVFEAALRNAESLSTQSSDDDFEFEDFIYVAVDVYEKKTGKDLYEELPVRILPGGMDPAGTRWSDDSDGLERRFPVLWAKFRSR